MDLALLIIVAAVALACPAHMLWRARRGRRAGCMPARDSDAAAVQEHQRALADRIARSGSDRP